MNNISMVAISGRGGSLFSSRMGDIWSKGSPFLGQAAQGQDLFDKAKADVAQWDSLVERLNHIGNATVANQLAVDYGITAPSNQDKGQYARDGVASNVAVAESFAPSTGGINYDVFRRGDVKNRVDRLDNYLSDFRHAVENAEALYGFARTITNNIYVPGTPGAPGAIPGWVLPVGVGIVGLGLLGAFGVIKI